MYEKKARGLYEAPEAEEIVLAERWDVLTDDSNPSIDDGSGPEEEDEY